MASSSQPAPTQLQAPAPPIPPPSAGQPPVKRPPIKVTRPRKRQKQDSAAPQSTQYPAQPPPQETCDIVALVKGYQADREQLLQQRAAAAQRYEAAVLADADEAVQRYTRNAALLYDIFTPS